MFGMVLAVFIEDALTDIVGMVEDVSAFVVVGIVGLGIAVCWSKDVLLDMSIATIWDAVDVRPEAVPTVISIVLVLGVSNDVQRGSSSELVSVGLSRRSAAKGSFIVTGRSDVYVGVDVDFTGVTRTKRAKKSLGSCAPYIGKALRFESFFVVMVHSLAKGCHLRES